MELRELRRAKGLSQTQLAEGAGVSRRQIGNFERGVSTNARLETVQNLADTLGVNTSRLVAGGPVHVKVLDGIFDLQLHVGIALSKLIAARGWSSRGLAQEVGLRPQHLRAIEAGQLDPTLRTLAKLAEELHTTAGGLIRAGELNSKGLREHPVLAIGRRVRPQSRAR